MPKPIAITITDTHLKDSTLEINFHVWKQAFELCTNLGIKQIFHKGDVFTSRSGQPEIVLNAFKLILDMANDLDIKILAIAGNHDKQSYISESSFLDAFNGQPSFQCISPFGTIRIHGTDTFIHFLPYYDEHLTYKNYLDQIELQDGKNILITHIGINGVINNKDSKVESGVNSNLFDNFDLVLIGHYHNRQIIGNRKHIVYTGSTHQANFGEDLYKGATVLYDDCTYEFVQFDFPQFNTIEIEATELNRDLLKQAKEKDENVNVRFKINGYLEEKHKVIISELQNLPGIKIESIKEDYNAINISQNSNVKMNNNDIIAVYDEWVNDRKIENSEFGKKLLNKIL